MEVRSAILFVVLLFPESLTNRLFVGRARGASIKVPRLQLGLQFRARHIRLLLLSPDSELISGANRPTVGEDQLQ